jgi:acyl carrier protein
MMKDAVLDKVRVIIAEILRCSPAQLMDTTSASDVERWDSLTNINIIISLEGAFKIKFALGEIQELKNIGGIVDLIVEKTT